MDIKGSMRGIKSKLMGLATSPSKNGSPKQDLHQSLRISSTNNFSSTPELSLKDSSSVHDEDSESPTPTKKCTSRSFTASMRIPFKRGIKGSKADPGSKKYDSMFDEYCPEVDSIKRSSPIPIPNPLQIQLPIKLRDSKSLEDLIAPDGYSRSLLSNKEAHLEDPGAINSPSVRRHQSVAENGEAEPSTLRARPLPAIPARREVKSFVMDDVFEYGDADPVETGIAIGAPPPASKQQTKEDGAAEPVNLAPFISPSTGHVDHITGEWRSNDPAGAAVIGEHNKGNVPPNFHFQACEHQNRTSSAQFRYCKNLARVSAGALLETVSMIDQIRLDVFDKLANTNPEFSSVAFNTDLKDNSSNPAESSAIVQPVKTPPGLGKVVTDAWSMPNYVATPQKLGWFGLSENEAISVIENVRMHEAYISKYGVEAFAKAMKNGSLSSTGTLPFSNSTSKKISAADVASSANKIDHPFGESHFRCPFHGASDFECGTKLPLRSTVGVKDEVEIESSGAQPSKWSVDEAVGFSSISPDPDAIEEVKKTITFIETLEAFGCLRLRCKTHPKKCRSDSLVTNTKNSALMGTVEKVSETAEKVLETIEKVNGRKEELVSLIRFMSCNEEYLACPAENDDYLSCQMEMEDEDEEKELVSSIKSMDYLADPAEDADGELVPLMKSMSCDEEHLTYPVEDEEKEKEHVSFILSESCDREYLACPVEDGDPLAENDSTSGSPGGIIDGYTWARADLRMPRPMV